MRHSVYSDFSIGNSASPGNQHCANCVGTLSFPIVDAPILMLFEEAGWLRFLRLVTWNAVLCTASCCACFVVCKSFSANNGVFYIAGFPGLSGASSSAVGCRRQRYPFSRWSSWLIAAVIFAASSDIHSTYALEVRTQCVFFYTLLSAIATSTRTSYALAAFVTTTDSGG